MAQGLEAAPAAEVEPSPSAGSARRVARQMADGLRVVGGVVAYPPLRRVQLAWSTCICAEWSQAVALNVFAFQVAGVVGVGVLNLVRTLPAAIAGPFVLGIADRFPRARILTAVLVVRGLLLGSIATALFAGAPPGPIYALAALDAVALAAWWPTHSALLPSLSRTPSELTGANVSTTTIENLGTLVGPVVAGGLLAVGSPAATLAFSAAAVLAGAALLVPLLGRRDRLGEDDTASTAQRLLGGFRTIAREGAPRLVAGLYVAEFFAIGALTTLVVVVALELLELGDSGVGMLTAAVGAGGLLGSLGTAALTGKRRLAGAFGVAILLVGAAIAGVGVAVVPAVVVALLALAGGANAFVDVTALTLLQRVIDERRLARTLGVLEGLYWAMLGLGALTASGLVELLGVRGGLFAVGGALGVLMLVAWSRLVHVDSASDVPERGLALLSRLPMFSVLPPPTLERLARSLEPVSFEAGDTVIRAGDQGDRFYVIDEGEVEVVAPNRRRRQRAGDHFGEIALMRGVPRTATVTALTSLRLLGLDREHFLSAVTGYEASSEAAERIVVGRLS